MSRTARAPRSCSPFWTNSGSLAPTPHPPSRECSDSSAPAVRSRPSRAYAPPGEAPAVRQDRAPTGNCVIGTSRGLAFDRDAAEFRAAPIAVPPSASRCVTAMAVVPARGDLRGTERRSELTCLASARSSLSAMDCAAAFVPEEEECRRCSSRSRLARVAHCSSPRTADRMIGIHAKA